MVGTSTATWRPALAAAKAARTATSVLPKPTSPQTTRSIGWLLARSRRVASMAASWSGVSSNGKVAANGSYIARSTSSAKPARALRLAWISSSSAATSRTFSAALRLALAHCSPPSECSGAVSGEAPE